MFFLHHPQPVRPRKAVPELQVSSQSQAIDTKTIVVEHSTEELRTLQLPAQAKTPADSK
ncbi:hypothetical protein H8L32_12215 [Undibacterium sp. CY18W]|uniref:Uncharacterized protein n=1 Tax=Undibacterium hunanense TaxID=2762292 RepID=A0ABR6ZQU3_9BURK|nr:hypothetical protein [Undibacterium hunanense]MBC3918246.1 hypothetical protein [Undibacterium hunanense]